MMYYSKEARESAIADIRSIISKLGEVKNGELDYLTYRGTVKYLNDLIEQIEKEQKAVSMQFKREPTLTTARGERESLSNLHFPWGKTVDDLYDAIEDSTSVSALVDKINKMGFVRHFNLDRETISYGRLKSIDTLGNISYLTIKKAVV